MYECFLSLSGLPVYRYYSGDVTIDLCIVHLVFKYCHIKNKSLILVPLPVWDHLQLIVVSHDWQRLSRSSSLFSTRFCCLRCGRLAYLSNYP